MINGMTRIETAELFKGFKEDIGHDELPVLVSNHRIYENHPTIGLVYSKFENGEIILYNPNKAMEHISGWTYEEMHNKPLSMFEKNPNILARMELMRKIEEHGAWQKTNMNLCKDGSLVKTYGIITKGINGTYQEMVFKLDDVDDIS